MGWLEVLALLKRLGPALSRLLPMMEMFVATRGNASPNTEAFDRVAGELKEQLAAASGNHAALTEMLSTQATQLGTFQDELRHIRRADEQTAIRLLEVETQVGTLSKALRQVRHLLMAVLALCAVLLAAVLFLLLRR